MYTIVPCETNMEKLYNKNVILHSGYRDWCFGSSVMSPPQDTYATTLFQFLSQERELAMKIHKVSSSTTSPYCPMVHLLLCILFPPPPLQLVILQITWHKQALGSLEAVLPRLDREMGKGITLVFIGQKLTAVSLFFCVSICFSSLSASLFFLR